MKARPVDFKQTDDRWKHMPYSTHRDRHQTLGYSGSGPTIAANVVATLKDETITPVETAQLALKWGCRTYNSGTTWGYFQKIASHFGFSTFAQTKEFDVLINCLNAGGLAVCAMRSGFWCRTANYILAWEHDNQYVYCNDSSSRMRTRQKIDDFKKESRMYFCFWP